MPRTRAIRQVRPLSWAAGKIVARSFGARGFAAADIPAHWPAIAGEEIAAYSWPERLLKDGTLRVRVCGPVAVELQHLETEILERIATYCGYRAAVRIVCVQGGSFEAPRERTPRPSPEIDSTGARKVENAVSGLGDTRLRRALETLGRAVLARKKDS